MVIMITTRLGVLITLKAHPSIFFSLSYRAFSWNSKKKVNVIQFITKVEYVLAIRATNKAI